MTLPHFQTALVIDHNRAAAAGPLMGYHFCAFAKSGTFCANSGVGQPQPQDCQQEKCSDPKDIEPNQYLTEYVRGKTMNQQIEFIARALYEAEDDAMAWEAEPEILKEEFRHYARAALALLAEDSQPAAKTETDKFPYAA